MHDSVWHWVQSVWRDVDAFRTSYAAQRERSELERTCREHGMLWLVDQRYADMIPVPVPIQRRRTATR